MIDTLIEEGRQSLLGYTNLTYPGYKADNFHRHLSGVLDKVISGDYQRRGLQGLILNAPPQVGKSELVSRRLPAYWLSKRPNDPIILTSYSAKLALFNSKKARATIGSELSHTLFPEVGFKQDSRAADFWELDGFLGYLLAGGVDGPLTGFGAKLGIIDDPFKSWAEAQSPTIRDSVWEWWKGTFRTRMAEDGFVIIMMTRWHQDDLVGRLLRDPEEKDRWLHLSYPALCEDVQNDPIHRQKGEALAPSRFGRAYLSRLKRTLGPKIWNAEYQQNPTPPGGTLFAIDKLQFIEPFETPTRFKAILRKWDLAATEKKGSNDPDYTSGPKIALGLDNRVYLLDLRRGRWKPSDLERQMIRTAKEDGNTIDIVIEREGGASGKIVIDIYKRMLQGFRVFDDKPSSNKVDDAAFFAAQVDNSNVYIVRAPWNDALVKEMEEAPNGEHDDQWDSISRGYNFLVTVILKNLSVYEFYKRQAAEQAAREAAEEQARKQQHATNPTGR